ncbi:MAG: phosphoribosylaminoimidazole chloroplastic-like [Trebouxia sp. A1-2]|nr:MAG: phosphoribosylaminoimidazole chloroplastic-like [Trebouxia sp. A1-2]
MFTHSLAERTPTSYSDGLIPHAVSCRFYPMRKHTCGSQQIPSTKRRSSAPFAVRCASVPDQASVSTISATNVYGGGMLRQPQKVGILGGGQLGKMLAMEAAKMGVRIVVLDPTPGCPASSVAVQIVGSFRDSAAVKQIAQLVDVLTVEIEHVDVDALESAALQFNVDVEPTPQTLRLIQDKYVQKQHFKQANVPIGDYLEVSNAEQAQHAGDAFGFPLMLKSRRFAYDGKGNAVVQSVQKLENAVQQLGGYKHGLYAEKWTPFVKELAVMVARSRSGETKAFPVVETIHKDNICHTTEAPARVPHETLLKAQQVAQQAVECLEGAGVFGVEMFLLADGSLLLNEIAPRPHNSGHYTIEACATSQYEQHLRAILGWPLGDTSLAPGTSVHWYGKEVQNKRKLGHITIVGPDNETAQQRLRFIDAAAADAMDAASQAYAEATSEESMSGQHGEAAAAGSTERVPDGESQPQASSSGRPESDTLSGPPQIGIIMGSDSDLKTMVAAEEVIHNFGVPCELTIVSAHRTPDRMLDYARNAHKRGVKVIIAGAGGAAHLPGMVAALTPLPTVGVPVTPAGAHLDGLDALLSIVQMPKGVPVATVAIGNAANAGLLALRILAASNASLQQRMLDYQDGMRDTVLEKARKVESDRM